MKLTKADRSAFIVSVTREFPSEHEPIEAEIIQLIENCKLKFLPPKLAAIYPEVQEFVVKRNTVLTAGLKGVYSPELIVNVYNIPLPYDLLTPNFPYMPEKEFMECLEKADPVTHAEVVKLLHRLGKIYEKKINAIQKLTAIIEGCTTLQKATEILPVELHKHLPSNRDFVPSKYPVAIPDILPELISAGWGKKIS